ncbi:ribosome biogenesis GTPase Der [Candidatus Omnitrophota bacterium]
MSRVEYNNITKIAIIGRPNVGKSSLFNKLLRDRKAIVESVSGVTRDRLYSLATIGSERFVIIDTGGIVSETNEKIAKLVYTQSKEAIAESDAIIFVCDAKAGLTYQDEHISSLIKASKKRVILAVNKVDSQKLESDIYDFCSLGIGEPLAVSVLHSRGIDRLRDNIEDVLLAVSEEVGPRKISRQQPAVKIAIAGRPNVGKSSFVNCLLKEDRLLVNDLPGTTRDSVDVSIRRDSDIIVLVDTAGIKHKRKIKETVDMFSLARTKQSVRRADITIVMIDATSDLCRDDIAVIDYVLKSGKACMLLVNKRDLVKDLDVAAFKQKLYDRFKPLEWIPIIFTSCTMRKNIIRAIDESRKIVKRSKSLIKTPKLNSLLEKLQLQQAHPSSKGARPKIFYATQVETGPPKFLLFCSNPSRIKADYLRYIEKNIRKSFNFDGVPIELAFKDKS